MFLRPDHRDRDGKRHTYWSLVETIRTLDGPRQRTLCHLGELNGSALGRWLKTIEVFNEAGDRHQLKLFPADVAPPPDDAEVAQVLVPRVRVERMRQLGPCVLGLTLWRQLQSDECFETRGRSRGPRPLPALSPAPLCTPFAHGCACSRKYGKMGCEDHRRDSRSRVPQSQVEGR